MKALTIKEPWATLIIDGYKKYEFRSWKTKYRGKILIHAGMSLEKDMLKKFENYNLECSKGQIIGEANLTDCILVDEKFNQATALAVQTFAQLMDMEEGELAITLLHTGLSEILGLNDEDEDEDEEGDEEVEDKKECKCGGNCECDGNCECHKEDKEDKEDKTLGEILSKYDEDEDTE